MKKLFHNKGQAVITKVIGFVIAAILGLSANQYAIVQRTTKLESSIENINKNIENLNTKFDSITKISIRQENIEKNNNINKKIK